MEAHPARRGALCDFGGGGAFVVVALRVAKGHAMARIEGAEAIGCLYILLFLKKVWGVGIKEKAIGFIKLTRHDLDVGAAAFFYADGWLEVTLRMPFTRFSLLTLHGVRQCVHSAVTS